MKYLFSTLVLTVFCMAFCEAQDWSGEVYKTGHLYPGYYITLEGDTVHGYIRHGSKTDNQKQFEFFENETDRRRTDRFRPADVKEYRVADKTYRTINFSGGLLSRPLRFNLLHEDGPIAQYTFYSEDKDQEEMIVFHKPHDPENADPITLQSFGLRFARNMSAYIHDHEELAEKVANRESGYGMSRLFEIIREYNEWYLNKP